MANIGVCFAGHNASEDIPLATKDGRNVVRIRRESKRLTIFFAQVKALAHERGKGTESDRRCSYV